MNKILWLVVAAVVGFSWSASGGLYSYTWTVGTAIPDGDPSGLVNNQVISDAIQGNASFPANPFIADIVQVGVNLSSASGSAGWNGDLYAYLRYDSGSGVGFTTLLNRVGTTTEPYNPIGYTTSGMNVYLTDKTADADIHYQMNPGPGSTYRVDSTGSSLTFDSFNGLNPVGTWSLFFADLSGQHQMQVNGWSLQMDVVPEPVNVALGIFGGVAAMVMVVRSKPVRTRIQRWRAAAVAWIDAV